MKQLYYIVIMIIDDLVADTFYDNYVHRMSSISVAPTCPISHLGPSLAEVCSASQFMTFMTILDMLVRSQERVSQSCERVRPTNPPEYYYDFIVIGGE